MVVRDTQAMIAGMTPELVGGTFVFCTTTEAELAYRCLPDALCLFREDEGISLVMPVETANTMGIDCVTPMRCIRLNVYSALDGVALTAAVAQTLSESAISCNVIAAFHHDHVDRPPQSGPVGKLVQGWSLHQR